MILWTGGELPEAHAAQLAPERLPAERDVELVPQPPQEVDEPPTHDAVALERRPRLDRLRERHALLRRSRGGLPGALRSTKPAGPSALKRATQSRTI